MQINKPLRPDLFNIDLLILNKAYVGNLREVTKLNIFESNTKVFEPLGLYSPLIFGAVGTTVRNQQGAYIDITLGVMHPLVYSHVVSLKALYKEILEGKTKAVFDKTISDFVQDDEGSTGYSFFVKHLDSIDFGETESDQRKYKIDLIKLYGNTASLIDKWYVLPAGLRDYSVDSKGTPTEDDVNNIYRGIIATSTILKNVRVSPENLHVFDSIRLKVQKLTIDCYEHFKVILDGKNKFIQGKWAKRAISYGTRNVITPIPTYVTDLKQTNRITVNHTTIGLYQYIVGISPITMNKVHGKFISKVFNNETDSAILINAKTLTREIVEVPMKKRDEWLSLEGLGSIMDKLKQPEIAKSDVIVKSKAGVTYYMAMILEDGINIKVVFDTHVLEPDELKKLRPITYLELFYISVVDTIDTYIGFLTRYPVAGLGGIYPTKLYVKTTTKGRQVNLEIDNHMSVVSEYPRLNDDIVLSLSPSYVKLGRLGADFDGDTVSLNIVYTDESLKELNDMLKAPTYYLTPGGELTYSLKTDTLDYVMKHITK